MAMTDRDIRDRIQTALHASGVTGDFDMESLTDEIIITHGLVHIDTIDAADFWETVARHDVSTD